MALRLAVVVSQAPGVGGYAVGRPPHDGGRERLGRRLLGDVEVTETPGQEATTRAHSSWWARVIASRTSIALHRNGRTSTFRLQAFDPRRRARAPRRDRGLDDPEAGEVLLRLHEGPVGEHRPSPRLSMTVAVRATRAAGEDPVPSARSRSLNASMAALLGPGGRSRCRRRSRKPGTCIWIISCDVGRPSWRLSPLLRTPLPRSDRFDSELAAVSNSVFLLPVALLVEPSRPARARPRAGISANGLVMSCLIRSVRHCRNLVCPHGVTGPHPLPEPTAPLEPCAACPATPRAAPDARLQVARPPACWSPSDRRSEVEVQPVLPVPSAHRRTAPGDLRTAAGDWIAVSSSWSQTNGQPSALLQKYPTACEPSRGQLAEEPQSAGSCCPARSRRTRCLPDRRAPHAPSSGSLAPHVDVPGAASAAATLATVCCWSVSDVLVMCRCALVRSRPLRSWVGWNHDPEGSCPSVEKK
jgi:hypothetical protein